MDCAGEESGSSERFGVRAPAPTPAEATDHVEPRQAAQPSAYSASGPAAFGGCATPSGQLLPPAQGLISALPRHLLWHGSQKWVVPKPGGGGGGEDVWGGVAARGSGAGESGTKRRRRKREHAQNHTAFPQQKRHLYSSSAVPCFGQAFTPGGGSVHLAQSRSSSRACAAISPPPPDSSLSATAARATSLAERTWLPWILW